MNWQVRNRELYKTRHATTSKRLADEVRLRKLRPFKHWRSAGHECGLILKRLKTTRESLKKWAKELDFDLGGTL